MDILTTVAEALADRIRLGGRQALVSDHWLGTRGTAVSIGGAGVQIVLDAECLVCGKPPFVRVYSATLKRDPVSHHLPDLADPSFLDKVEQRLTTLGIHLGQ